MWDDGTGWADEEDETWDDGTLWSDGTGWTTSQ